MICDKKILRMFVRPLRLAMRGACALLLVGVILAVICGIVLFFLRMHESGTRDANSGTANLFSLYAQGLGLNANGMSAGVGEVQIKFDGEKILVENLSFAKGALEASIPSLSMLFTSENSLALQNLSIYTPQIKAEAFEYGAKLATATDNFSKISLYDLQMKSPTLAVTVGAIDVTDSAPITNFAEIISGIGSLNRKGNWKLTSLNAKSGDFVLPEISGGGTFSVNNSNTINIHGKAVSADKTIDADFVFTHTLSNNKSVLRINNISYAYASGVLLSSDIVLILGAQTPTNFAIQIKDVKANEILHTLLGDKLTVTGNISGSLPIEVTSNFAQILVKDGSLYATEPGILYLTPDYIPGDNPAVALVKEIVQNFHFSTLVFSVNTAEDGRIVINMSIAGNNPDVENGRPVKMKVNLGGDILSIVQQNLTLYKEPMKLLQQRGQ